MVWNVYDILNGRQSEMLESYFDISKQINADKNPNCDQWIKPRLLRMHKDNIPLLCHCFRMLEQL